METQTPDMDNEAADSGDPAMDEAADAFLWPLRPVIVALFLAFCGLMVHWILDGSGDNGYSQDAGRQAFAAFFFFGGLAFCFALERVRWIWSVIFGLVAGAVLAGITYWVAGYSQRGFEWNWAFGAGLIALAIATPLFQTFRDEGRAYFPYPRLHFHAWTDAVIYFASLAFVGLSWLLLLLIGGLFDLIGIDFIRDLMDDGWFGWTFSGLSFGAALGILRENEKILATLQRVVLIILSILAPPLALGLTVFLVLLLFTGLDVLWDATDATTPILMACAIGAVILANAVIRDSEAETSRSTILQWSALVLGLNILPLALIAAISMGLRVDQYGLTPERAWGVLVVTIATAYGVAYLVSILRKRTAWAQAVRPANIRLTMALCGICLFLALPIADFGAMSAKDQMARLKSGQVSAEDFDYFAFAYDFGPAGRAALAQLSKGQLAAAGLDPADKKQAMQLAQKALDSESRWDADMQRQTVVSGKALAESVQILPKGTIMPEGLADALKSNRSCQQNACILFIDNPRRAVFVERPCDKCLPTTAIYYLTGDEQWQRNWSTQWNKEQQDYWQNRAFGNITQESDIEVRDIRRKQIFVDGEPFSEPF